MKNFRIFLITIIVTIALAGFFWLAYTLYNKFQRPVTSPFNAIPGNTALIIQLNKAGNLLEELNRSNLLWKAISRFPGINSIRNELNYVDSSRLKNEKISKIFQQYNILISITLSGKTNFGALYLANVSGSDPESYILDFINEITAEKAIHTQSPYYTTTLHRIQAKGKRDAFYFAVLKGVFIGSFHANLVKRAVDRLSLNTPLATSAGFRKVQASAGKKVDANIFINYRFFSLVLSKITHDDNIRDLLRFAEFADWSGMDLIIKKDELFFNGFTVASDSSQHFLALFNDQKPQKKEIATIIPEKALYFTSFGWSDPSRFSQRFQGRTPQDETMTTEQITAMVLIDQYQLNIGEYFLSWMGNEASYFVIKGPKSAGEVPLLAFRSLDTLRTASSLLALADTLGINTDSVPYLGHKIYKMELPAFLPALFGDIFGKVNVRAFTFIKGYVIFADQPGDLKMVIDAVTKNATLDQDKVYIDFERTLSEKSSVFCYFNTPQAISSLKEMLSKDLSDQINPMTDTLRKFESVAFQYNNNSGIFYSSIFLRYNPNLDKEGPLQWQVKLDTTMAGRPRIIQVTVSGDKAVAALDVANNLYLVSPDGHINWKLHIMGKLLGEIHPINLGTSDSLFLLFNTDTHLYLLTIDGQFVDKYPMRFPLHATNGISITDWERNKDFNILVAFQDNRLYNFNLNGNSVDSWHRPKLDEEIVKPATVTKAGANKYILFSGITGKTAIVNPDGEAVITPGAKFVHAPASGIYPNKTNKKALFLTTEPNGKVVFIQGNGQTSEVTLNLFSPAHFFFYEDITGNADPEYIFIDRNKIFYYGRNNKLIYSYAFRHEISSPPFLMYGQNKKILVGFVSPETNELFLFDNHGNRELEAGIRGNTPFDVGSLENPLQVNLVVGEGKLLKNYRLPQL